MQYYDDKQFILNKEVAQSLDKPADQTERSLIIISLYSLPIDKPFSYCDFACSIESEVSFSN